MKIKEEVNNLDEFFKEKEKYDLIWQEWKKSNDKCKKLRKEINFLKMDLKECVSKNKELRVKVISERDRLIKSPILSLKTVLD